MRPALLNNSTEFFRHVSTRLAGWILCFAGGYTDTVGFILLKSLFCASITGNLVKIAQIVEKKSDISGYIVITIAYGFGSGTTRMLSTYLKSRRDLNLSFIAIIIFIVEIVWLVTGMLVGSYLEGSIEESVDMNTLPVIVTGVLIAMAMGTQAGVASNVFTTFPNTTGMTASVASAFSSACTLLLLYLRMYHLSYFYLTYEETRQLSDNTNMESDKAEHMLLVEKSHAAVDDLTKQFGPLIFFILGAFAGAYTASKMKFWSIAIPVFIVIVLIFELYTKNDQKGGNIGGRQLSSGHLQLSVSPSNGDTLDLIPNYEIYPEYEI